MRIRLLAASLLLALSCASGGSTTAPASAPKLVSDGRLAMGTVLEITVVEEEGADAEAREIIDELFEKIAEIEGKISSWDPESDVSRLNREAHRAPQQVAEDVSAVLSQSLVYTTVTRGTFDVTIGPLVELWIDAARTGVPPTPEELDRARELVGAGYVRVYGDGRVSFAREGVAIDLGGVAKGYALDQLVPKLRKLGIRSGLLSFGQSSTWALGAPPGAHGWRLLVRGPASSAVGLVTLRDQALSVSGSLGEFAVIEGVEYGHILDPRTGMPLTRRRQAVVVARSASLAEALSKALLIAGEEEGIAIVEAQPNCEGMLADEDGTITTTSGWPAAVDFEPLEPESETQVR
ncbi:MAG: FAD:protein FMN transferase [Myxococcales bacterium]|nr:FAD:protein FMN transferase [Myxococcales bacterium]